MPHCCIYKFWIFENTTPDSSRIDELTNTFERCLKISDNTHSGHRQVGPPFNDSVTSNCFPLKLAVNGFSSYKPIRRAEKINNKLQKILSQNTKNEQKGKPLKGTLHRKLTMPILRWNCSVCRQQLNFGPKLCTVCNSMCHIYCVRTEEFWNRPSRNICRKCFIVSQRNQELLQTLQRQIRRDSTRLMSIIQTLSEDLGGNMTEHEEDIEAFMYHVTVIQEMTQTLTELRGPR